MDHKNSYKNLKKKLDFEKEYLEDLRINLMTNLNYLKKEREFLENKKKNINSNLSV